MHRRWLVNLAFVREVRREQGATTLLIASDIGSESISAPVSRDRLKAVRDVLLQNAIGLRRPA